MIRLLTMPALLAPGLAAAEQGFRPPSGNIHGRVSGGGLRCRARLDLS